MLDRYILDDDSDYMELPYAVRVALYYEHPTGGERELSVNPLPLVNFDGYTRKDFAGTLSTVGNSVYLTNTSSITWTNTGSTAWPYPPKWASLWIHFISSSGNDLARRLITTEELPLGSTVSNLGAGDTLCIGQGALTLEWT